jgi:hypothetical protein
MISRILLQPIRKKSVYEFLNISETSSSKEVFDKINEISKTDELITTEFAREIKRFKIDRFNYDVIIKLEEKRLKNTVDDVLPPFINPQTEKRIVNYK